MKKGVMRLFKYASKTVNTTQQKIGEYLVVQIARKDALIHRMRKKESNNK
jgi:hypothetical protein